jgi:hypothetical protein
MAEKAEDAEATGRGLLLFVVCSDDATFSVEVDSLDGEEEDDDEDDDDDEAVD